MVSRCFLLVFALLALALSPSALAEPEPRPTPAPAQTRAGLAEGLGITFNDPLAEVVATIDGAPIRRDELDRTFQALLATSGRALSELSPEERKKGDRSVMEEMISDRLLTREAANEKVDDAEVEKSLATVRQSFPNSDAFEAELKKTGQTLDQVKANLRNQLRQQKWIEAKVAGRLQVAPQEVDKFYRDNAERFNLPETIRASHILFAVRRDAPPEDVLDKENLANSIAARLKKGEAFDDLARRYSDDPNAKQTGGDLDYFGRDQIMPEIAEAAFKLKAGEISAPVRTPVGFHLLKVTDRKPPRVATLEEERPHLVNYLREAKRRQAVSDLLANLRGNARIEIRLP